MDMQLLFQSFLETINNLDLALVFEFVKTNFIAIVICLGLLGVAIKIANTFIKIFAVVVCFLLVLKIFFL